MASEQVHLSFGWLRSGAAKLALALFLAKPTASWLINSAYAADWQAFQRDGEVNKKK